MDAEAHEKVFLHFVRATLSVESQRWRASGRGSKSSRGTAANKILTTAQRSRRASESWKGKRRESRGAVEVWENHTRDSGQASRDRALLAPTGADGDSLQNGVRADQSLKRRWYLLESERFGEEHEGKYDSHGLSPCGHCGGCTHKTQQQIRKQGVNRRDFLRDILLYDRIKCTR